MAYFNKIGWQIKEASDHYYSTEPGKSPPLRRTIKKGFQDKVDVIKSKYTRNHTKISQKD